jgi:hypothetical protein
MGKRTKSNPQSDIQRKSFSVVGFRRFLEAGRGELKSTRLNPRHRGMAVCAGLGFSSAIASVEAIPNAAAPMLAAAKNSRRLRSDVFVEDEFEGIRFMVSG